MQPPHGGGIAIEPDDRNDAYRLVVSDVISLIEHVKASLALIEHEIARETATGSQDTSNSVIVMDDVTPPYARATAALIRGEPGRSDCAEQRGGAVARRGSTIDIRTDPADGGLQRIAHRGGCKITTRRGIFRGIVPPGVNALFKDP